MNKKTEELREIFTSVTDGEETVTESQVDTRGSLEQDERSVESRLRELLTQMRERYGFETPLTDDELLEVAEGFYDEEDDAVLASRLDVEEDVVFEARLSMHLISDDDAAEIDLVAIRDRDESAETLAAEYNVDPETIIRHRRVATAKAESRAANDRYRDEFDTILADAALSGQLATNVREDGLEDATEGMETNVDF